MAHDLIIRSGTVVDGTGADPFTADVAIDGDRISAIGDLATDTANREIDATGLVVSPGFVDLHTHLDAQVGWDPLLTSSSWHGVTTVLIGNCGVSFAPVVPDDREFLAEMMESVEDVPRGAILDGLPWSWSTYPEYLDAVQEMAPALNIAGLVGHCAVRYHVMGERSLSDEPPTAADLNRMRAIAEESIAGGAVGFSTSRQLLHVVPDGRCVPVTFAPIDEYLAVADGMNAAGGGLFQAVNDFAGKREHETELLTEMARSCGDVLFSGGVGNGDRSILDSFGRLLHDVNADAGRITMAMQTRPSGSLCGLAQIAPVKGKRWRAVMELPTIADRVAALKDPETRAGLEAEGRDKGLWYDPRHIHPLGTADSPDYHEAGGKSVAELAEDAGVHPVTLVIDRLIESDGRELFNTWFFTRNVEALPEALTMDHVYPGLADTGAHAGQICDADMSTHLLSYWQRDRGLYSLAEAVRRLTSLPASVLGLVERGTLAPGQHADVNVFDIDRLASQHPTYVNDFPGGAGRFQIGATGYAATLVNGTVVTEQGTNTGARPGQVLRQFARG
ncbi:MAG: N-acyl-D-amino-acid deacylase family protein [Desertimonas sp.]